MLIIQLTNTRHYKTTKKHAVSEHIPGLRLHVRLHDHVPVDVKDSLAGVHLLFQQHRELLADLLQENVGCVGDEHLKDILETLSEHDFTAVLSVFMYDKC